MTDKTLDDARKLLAEAERELAYRAKWPDMPPHHLVFSHDPATIKSLCEAVIAASVREGAVPREPTDDWMLPANAPDPREPAKAEPVAWRYRYCLSGLDKGDWNYVEQKIDCSKLSHYEAEPLYSAAGRASLPVPLTDKSDELVARLRDLYEGAPDGLQVTTAPIALLKRTIAHIMALDYGRATDAFIRTNYPAANVPADVAALTDKTLDDARKLLAQLRKWIAHAEAYQFMHTIGDPQLTREAADYIEAVIAASVPSGTTLTDEELPEWLPILEDRDLSIAEFHAMQQKIAAYIRAGAASVREGAVPRIATGAMSRGGDEKLWAYHVEGTDPDVSALWTVMYDAAPREPAKAEPVAWMPIDDATPRDNKRPLLLAHFGVDGQMIDVDFDGIWDSEIDGWEYGNNISCFWGSANGHVEEPTHWMYQPDWWQPIYTREPGSGA